MAFPPRFLRKGFAKLATFLLNIYLQYNRFYRHYPAMFFQYLLGSIERKVVFQQPTTVSKHSLTNNSNHQPDNEFQSIPIPRPV